MLPQRVDFFEDVLQMSSKVQVSVEETPTIMYGQLIQQKEGRHAVTKPYRNICSKTRRHLRFQLLYSFKLDVGLVRRHVEQIDLARKRIIADNFNAWVTEWTSSLTNARQHCLLEIFVQFVIISTNKDQWQPKQPERRVQFSCETDFCQSFNSSRYDVSNYSYSDHQTIVFGWGHAPYIQTG